MTANLRWRWQHSSGIVQWRSSWTATPGRHRVSVRATDGDGVVQEDRITRPDPDGARGYHTIEVSVA